VEVYGTAWRIRAPRSHEKEVLSFPYRYEAESRVRRSIPELILAKLSLLSPPAFSKKIGGIKLVFRKNSRALHGSCVPDLMVAFRTAPATAEFSAEAIGLDLDSAWRQQVDAQQSVFR